MRISDWSSDVCSSDLFDKAGFTGNPLEDGTLDRFRTLKIDISKLTLEAVKEAGVTSKEGLRAKNFWTLRLVYWLYGRRRQPTVSWLNRKFAKRPELADAHIPARNGGQSFGETADMPAEDRKRDVQGKGVAGR